MCLQFCCVLPWQFVEIMPEIMKVFSTLLSNILLIHIPSFCSRICIVKVVGSDDIARFGGYQGKLNHSHAKYHKGTL